MGHLRLHLPGRHHRHLRPGSTDERGQHADLCADHALPGHLLQAEPARVQHHHVVVHRQETVVPAAAVTPPEGLRPPGELKPNAERPTRKPLPVWDRIKFLLLLALVWVLLTWSVMANNPLVGFSDAVRTEARAGWWVFVLMGLEAIRQIHYLISEHWAAYHRFWTYRVFGGFERMSHRRLSDWTRF